jgi:hypothetical protein
MYFFVFHSTSVNTLGGAGSKRRGLSLAAMNFHFEGRTGKLVVQ